MSLDDPFTDRFRIVRSILASCHSCSQPLQGFCSLSLSRPGLMQVEKLVEVPVHVEKRVEVPVPYEKLVHIEVPVEHVVYKDVQVPVTMNPERVVVKEIPTPYEVIKEIPHPVERVVHKVSVK